MEPPLVLTVKCHSSLSRPVSIKVASTAGCLSRSLHIHLHTRIQMCRWPASLAGRVSRSRAPFLLSWHLKTCHDKAWVRYISLPSVSGHSDRQSRRLSKDSGETCDFDPPSLDRRGWQVYCCESKHSGVIKSDGSYPPLHVVCHLYADGRARRLSRLGVNKCLFALQFQAPRPSPQGARQDIWVEKSTNVQRNIPIKHIDLNQFIGHMHLFINL